MGKFGITKLTGIYKITNNINKKLYIGQAVDIQARWNQHKRNFNNPFCFKTSPKLYSAFLKYGVENFNFEVVESHVPIEQLTEREEYWIRFYNAVEQGYNCVYPSEVFRGEHNPNATLTLEQVLEIKELLINSKISQQEIATMYGVAASTIYRINKGENWKDDNSSYPLRTWNELAHYGEKSGKSKLSDKEVMQIRQRYVNETPKQIWEQSYKNLYSLSGFSKICRGETYSHLPCYNKDKQLWYTK